MDRTKVRHASRDRGETDADPWAVRLSAHETNACVGTLGRLRLLPSVQVCRDGDVVWLRGDDLNDHVSKLLRSLPDAERFQVTSDGQLTAWGESVPQAKLPTQGWHPLLQWLAIELPTRAFAAQVEQRVPMTLVRTDAVAEANMLTTRWPIWRDYATTAPQIRMNQWSFAVSDSGEVLIRGLPLPPIPGRAFVEQSGVAIPAGWTPNPQLDSESIRRILQLNPDEIALFRENATMEVMPESVFVRATRSAVRLTDASLTGML